MKRQPAPISLFLFALLFFVYPFSADAQTRKPAVRLHFDTKDYAVEGGRKSFLSDFNLYTIVRGRRYFIERINQQVASIPEPLLDPTARLVFYAVNTGGGFENEGMTIFVSDIYGRKKMPILGRSWVLRPAGFLQRKGRTYLLITGESESPARDFWLYDIAQGRFVLHADGEIRRLGKGLFSYGLNNDEDEFKELGRVTMEHLINHRAPLKLLPRSATQGLTQKRNVRIYESELCHSVNESTHQTIATAGTKVLILSECEDGGYAVYYKGFMGKVMKNAIRASQFDRR